MFWRLAVRDPIRGHYTSRWTEFDSRVAGVVRPPPHPKFPCNGGSGRIHTGVLPDLRLYSGRQIFYVVILSDRGGKREALFLDDRGSRHSRARVGYNGRFLRQLAGAAGGNECRPRTV